MVSMNDYFKVVAPDVPSTLVSASALERVQRVCEMLPPATCAGLECRLGGVDPQVDYLYGLPTWEHGFADMFSAHPKYNLEPHFHNSNLWQRILLLCQGVITTQSLLYNKLDRFWLEFDLEPNSNRLLVPGLFYGPKVYSEDREGLSSVYIHPVEAMKRALEILAGGAYPQIIWDNIADCIRKLPRASWITQIGVMMSRPSDAVRLCILGIKRNELGAFLAAINWTGSLPDATDIFSELAQRAEYVSVNIDLGRRPLPQIGFECAVELPQRPVLDQRWLPLLRFLVDNGLCSPHEESALLEWPGFVTEEDSQERLPANLEKFTKLLNARYKQLFFRVLSHVKVILREKRHLEAKAYLGYRRSWARVAGSPL